MPKPPVYDHNKLKNESQFLCVRGGTVQVNKLDIDFNPINDYLTSYYCKSTTKLPFEILNTGNIEVLTNYLEKHGEKLPEKEKQHLRERIDVMLYFNELEEYYQNNRRPEPQPMRNINGKTVLPGISLEQNQTSNNGCWSCAFSMLLKGRGVNLDQKVIRRYRPEFAEGYEVNNPKQTDIINSDEMSEIYQYSSLVGKVCPNTKMCKMNKKGEAGATNSEILTQVLRTLREKNSPVAFCNGWHWTTIVGVSEDNSQFYVVDSMDSAGGKIKPVNVKSYLDNSNAEFVWLEDIVLESDGSSKQLPDNRFRVDKNSGTVTVDIKGNAEIGSSNMSVGGNHIIDKTAHMEYYVPTMIRDYSKPYAEQKNMSDKYLQALGKPLKSAPKKPAYTSTSDFTYEKVEEKLSQQAEGNVATLRMSAMRKAKVLSQRDINDMSAEVANKCYEFFVSHPGEEIPDHLIFPEIAQFMAMESAENEKIGQENVIDINALDDPIPQQDIKPEGDGSVIPGSDKDINIPADNSPPPVDGAPKQAENDDSFNIINTDAVPEAKADSTVKFQDKAQDNNDFSIFSNAEAPGEEIKKPSEEIKEQSGKAPAPGSLQEQLRIMLDAETANEKRSPEKPPVDVPVSRSASADIEIKESAADIEARDRKYFAELGRALEKAKTVTNSKQYRLLTDTIQALGSEKQAKGMSEEIRAQLMVAAAVSVKDYIAHKAADGVKPNVFRKLAAVEAASRFLNEKLKPYCGKTYTIGKRSISVDSLNLSFKAQYNAASGAAKSGFDQMVGRMPVDKRLSAIQGDNVRAIAKHTNSCMNKILLNAIETSSSIIPELDAMRVKFSDGKFAADELSGKKEIQISTKAPKAHQL